MRRTVRRLALCVAPLVLLLIWATLPIAGQSSTKNGEWTTYGGDLAHGIRLAMESPAALNNDFNLSTSQSTTVLELAETIWSKIHADGKPFAYTSDKPFEHDVQLRVPDVRKAKDVLGYEATTSLETMLDEVIPWIRDEVEAGRL